jgi:hypothetical protein
MMSGVTTLPLTRSSAVMASAGADSINATNWPTTPQRDQNSYFTLSLTAPVGCKLALSSISLDLLSSSTGPVTAGLATSQDGFTHETPLSTSAPAMVSLSATGQTIELRIFGYAAFASSGTMRVQHQLSIMGTMGP